MIKAILIMSLLVAPIPANEASDRAAITRTVVSSSRVDPAKAAELTTVDFDGELITLPEVRPWCELDCPRISVRSVRFITPDVALVDGAASGDGVLPSQYIAVMKRDGITWRIAS